MSKKKFPQEIVVAFWDNFEHLLREIREWTDARVGVMAENWGLEPDVVRAMIDQELGNKQPRRIFYSKKSGKKKSATKKSRSTKTKKKAGSSFYKLGSTNEKIAAILVKNPSATATEISKDIGRSTQAIYNSLAWSKRQK